MTTAEHLIENAISFFEESDCVNFENFKTDKLIKEQVELVGINLHDLWYMAQYIYYTYTPYIRNKMEDEMIERYGYRPIEE